MRSSVEFHSRFLSFVILGFAIAPSEGITQQTMVCAANTVTIECESTQFALCVVMDGHTKGLCRTQRSGEDMESFLGRIVSEQVGNIDISSSEFRNLRDSDVILREGNRVFFNSSEVSEKVKSLRGRISANSQDSTAQEVIPETFLCAVNLDRMPDATNMEITEIDGASAEEAVRKRMCEKLPNCDSLINAIVCEQR